MKQPTCPRCGAATIRVELVPLELDVPLHTCHEGKQVCINEQCPDGSFNCRWGGAIVR